MGHGLRVQVGPTRPQDFHTQSHKGVIIVWRGGAKHSGTLRNKCITLQISFGDTCVGVGRWGIA